SPAEAPSPARETALPGLYQERAPRIFSSTDAPRLTGGRGCGSSGMLPGTPSFAPPRRTRSGGVLGLDLRVERLSSRKHGENRSSRPLLYRRDTPIAIFASLNLIPVIVSSSQESNFHDFHYPPCDCTRAICSSGRHRYLLLGGGCMTVRNEALRVC